MTVLVRRLSLFVLLGVATAAVAACSGTAIGGQGGPTTSASSSSSSGDAALSALDPCTLLTSQELQQYNVATKGDKNTTSDEVGCDYVGNYPAPSLSISKSKDSVQSYVQRSDTFVKLVQNTVNGRAGVQTRISSSNDECSQVMAVGSGDVRIGLTGDKSGDPCGDVLKIAQVVEPRLPK